MTTDKPVVRCCRCRLGLPRRCLLRAERRRNRGFAWLPAADVNSLGASRLGLLAEPVLADHKSRGRPGRDQLYCGV